MNDLVELIRRNPDYAKEAREYMARLGLASGEDLYCRDRWTCSFKGGECSKIPSQKSEFYPEWNRAEIKAKKDKEYSLIVEECRDFLRSWNLKRLIDPDDRSFDSEYKVLINEPTVLQTKGELIGKYIKPKLGCHYLEIPPGALKADLLAQVNDLYRHEKDFKNKKGPSNTQRDLRIFDLKKSGLTSLRIAELIFPGQEGAKNKVEVALKRITERIENIKLEFPS